MRTRNAGAHIFLCSFERYLRLFEKFLLWGVIFSVMGASNV